MKRLFQTIALFLVTTQALDAHAMTKNPNSIDPFEIKCTMKNHEIMLKKAELVIYKEGQVFKKIETTNGEFEIELPAGGNYLLEFIVDSHFTKRIAVNTIVDNLNQDVPPLDLTMTLIPTEYFFLPEYDQDLLDFPVAYLAFDGEKNTFFDINEEYSKVLMKDINKKSKKYMKQMSSEDQLSMK